MRVLVVDDHAETRQLLVRTLQTAGCTTTPVGSCADAAAALDRGSYDVIVLDVMLPDGSGVELCRDLRRRRAATPILLLTARGEVRDRVVGLEAGADDYLAKPFAVSELVARVRALARRGPAVREQVVRAGPVTIDLARRRVACGGRGLPLTARELAIVELLALRRGAVVERDDLLESVWGDVTDSARASLEVLMARIRRKLGPAAAVIRTVRGIGYALDRDG